MCIECDNIETWKGSASSILFEFLTIDFYDGDLLALGHCRSCGTPILLAVLAWDPPRSTERVYAICPFPVDINVDVRAQIEKWNALKGSQGGNTDAEFDVLVQRILESAGKPKAILLRSSLHQNGVETRKCPEPPPLLNPSDKVCSSTILAQWLDIFRS